MVFVVFDVFVKMLGGWFELIGGYIRNVVNLVLYCFVVCELVDFMIMCEDFY